MKTNYKSDAQNATRSGKSDENLPLSFTTSEDALFTFRNINASNKQLLADVPSFSDESTSDNNPKPQRITNCKKLTFDPNTKSHSDVLEELNECGERAFGPLAQQMIECSLYAKLPPHLKRSIILAYSENGAYEQIVTSLKSELDLSGLETDGEIPFPTMTTTKTTLNKQIQPQKA